MHIELNKQWVLHLDPDEVALISRALRSAGALDKDEQKACKDLADQIAEQRAAQAGALAAQMRVHAENAKKGAP
jgi:hypothetical protein